MEYQKITKFSKNSQRNSEIVTNENNKEMPKERYVSRRNTKDFW